MSLHNHKKHQLDEYYKNFLVNVRKVPVAIVTTVALASLAHAKEGKVVVEPFTCEVALLNFEELQRRLSVTSKDDWKYPIFQKESILTMEALEENECIEHE